MVEHGFMSSPGTWCVWALESPSVPGSSITLKSWGAEDARVDARVYTYRVLGKVLGEEDGHG